MDTTYQVPNGDNTDSRDRVLTGLLVLITISLLVLIGLVGFSTFKLVRIAESVEATQTRNEALDRKYKTISRVVSDQSELINGLLDSYQSDAYDNVNTDRITEQQLIAAEYQLTALQLIALQNNEIIQLLSLTLVSPKWG